MYATVKSSRKKFKNLQPIVVTLKEIVYGSKIYLDKEVSHTHAYGNFLSAEY